MKVYFYEMSKYKLIFDKVVEYNLLMKNRFGFFMFYNDFVPIRCISLTKFNEFSFYGNPIFFKKLKKSEEEKFYKKFGETYNILIK